MRLTSYNVNGTGFKGGSAPPVPAQGLTGHADGLNLWVPSREHIAAMLPQRWRHAFAHAAFWYDAHDNKKPCRADLYDSRGRYLTQVWAHPVFS
ncbi:hypothetical protein CcrMagneto_gp335 [Caulobacter virus Magneto]|uniref:hypothetical protein n=1 Tax=Caulobacter virus Magneto TaxID=1211642 RepID=UPI00028AE3A4|nr:hypothetical protein CcrMagneto_gp007 [Caulobacter virus Magneto]YP_006989017.1 hypothetical protein CcrMagneto_gp335 [Caulobacter virus Magneto]AFU87177.1 hypothetical protein CcrMagneto_gp007 [Caulobacter virus Magneto]AFU87505.1 hypothetical protein CcrMagneto_gp335 [Caulobacter virus Magneto]